MCELLGMSANVPTDLCFSFTGLRQRGGGTGPHKDGWGVIFYEGIGIRSFHDPGASVSSEVANLLARYPIKSTVAMCHIRQANVGSVALENTHPFVREFGGRYWSFAHNGQLPGFHLPDCGMAQRYRPVGQTDSEALFCCLLNEMLEEGVDALDREQLVQRIVGFCAQHAQTGVFNIILSNGLWLFSFCSTKLACITRRAPFRPATLRDGDIKVDFRSETTPHDVVSVVATSPLTYDEGWRTFAPGDWCVWEAGELVGAGHVDVPRFAHPKDKKPMQAASA
ncbi:class II glutamine amidotransferase [Chromatocurvus halotolerans]|nr:class II glutamine amidotransferase [Chromatocurvus halotolerans]